MDKNRQDLDGSRTAVEANCFVIRRRYSSFLAKSYRDEVHLNLNSNYITPQTLAHIMNDFYSKAGLKYLYYKQLNRTSSH